MDTTHTTRIVTTCRRNPRLTVLRTSPREVPPSRVIVLPAPGGVLVVAPAAPSIESTPNEDDLALATWEDAEWR